MSGKGETIQAIESFLQNENTGILLTGNNLYDKHLLVMEVLDKHFRGAHILFRINSMQNIPESSFLGCLGVYKQPKSGQTVEIGYNYYEFDSLMNQGTWHRTSHEFDFAICYPIDALAGKKDCSPIENLYRWKRIKKVFLCSWYDHTENDYSFLRKYYDQHIIYDKENSI